MQYTLEKLFKTMLLLFIVDFFLCQKYQINECNSFNFSVIRYSFYQGNAEFDQQNTTFEEGKIQIVMLDVNMACGRGGEQTLCEQLLLTCQEVETANNNAS
ncbi:hypothetical protein T06_16490 [Trichinella sp. T6]|nr:hypothetical protein T06_16490 [Trichinella sp. T6]